MLGSRQLGFFGRKTTLPAPHYDSGLQTVTFDSRLELPHGFGVTPSLFHVTLVCSTINQNYAVGDEVSPGWSGANTSNAGLVTFANATNVVIVTGNGIDILDHDTAFSTAALTAASWRYRARAWR